MEPNTNANTQTKTETMQKAEELLTKVRIQVLMKSEFFSCIMLGLEHEVTEAVPTAATNGVKILFNPNFLLELTVEQGLGLMIHEIEHVALLHPVRKGSRDPKKHNYACDYVINGQLDDQGYELPPGGLIDHKYDNMTSEAVYELLKDIPEGEPTPGTGDDILDPPDDMNPEELEQKVNELLVQAEMQSSQRRPGEYIPDALRRQIQDFLDPVVPWQILLQNYINGFAREDSSWSRPNRRYLPDFYLPSNYSEGLKNLTVVVDTSGSITVDGFKTYMSEVEGIRSIFTLDRLRLISTDTEIRSDEDVLDGDSLLDCEPKGFGGTDFRHVFNELKKDKPTVLIFFTDMCFYFNFDPPDFPVIWINTSNQEKAPAAYGETINVKPR